MKKNYIRDGRAPIPENQIISKVMSANKAKNTVPELLMRKALFNAGAKGYRIHWKQIPGRPDIAFPGKRVAVFVNGCYWHRCPTVICEHLKQTVSFGRLSLRQISAEIRAR